MTELLRELSAAGVAAAACAFTPAQLAALVRLVEEGAISGTVGKQVLADLFARGGDPAAYVKDKGLAQISDASSLEAAVDEVLAACPAECARYRAGEKKLTGFFVGQVMKKTRGQANPKLVAELLTKKLGG
jgi:aspartyl-tRNA(Asn)/glutamyl-tRNA(Gln) amidotransferase subunit B